MRNRQTSELVVYPHSPILKSLLNPSWEENFKPLSLSGMFGLFTSANHIYHCLCGLNLVFQTITAVQNCAFRRRWPKWSSWGNIETRATGAWIRHRANRRICAPHSTHTKETVRPGPWSGSSRPQRRPWPFQVCSETSQPHLCSIRTKFGTRLSVKLSNRCGVMPDSLYIRRLHAWRARHPTATPVPSVPLPYVRVAFSKAMSIS